MIYDVILDESIQSHSSPPTYLAHPSLGALLVYIFICMPRLPVHMYMYMQGNATADTDRETFMAVHYSTFQMLIRCSATFAPM